MNVMILKVELNCTMNKERFSARQATQNCSDASPCVKRKKVLKRINFPHSTGAFEPFEKHAHDR